MNFFMQMINLQLMLFMLILIGVILKCKNILTDAGQKTLSNLVINIVLPCNIIESFLGDYDISESFLKTCIIALLISAGIQVFSTFIGKYVFGKFPTKKRNIFCYGLIVSNSSYIGIPVVDAIYGNLGVLYTSLFQIPVRLTMWTAGLALFTDVNKKDAYKKLIKHPCIIAIFIGVALMLLPVSLPTFIDNTLNSISKCTTPLSMIAIGAMFADSKLKQLLDPSILYYCLIRLIAYPLLVLGMLKLLQIDALLTGVTTLLTAMPMAGTTAILADKYDYEPEFASQVIFVSTLLSIVTLPFLSLIC